MDQNCNLKRPVWLPRRERKDKVQSGCGDQLGIKVIIQVGGGDSVDYSNARAEGKKPADLMTA